MRVSRPASGASRPGRPAGFEREEAVGAAMQLFWKRGFQSVTASDLAEAMSIRRSSFYNSFGSREAVFREGLARYAAAAPDAPLDRFDAGRSGVGLLVDVMREACRVRAADPEARGCLACNSIAELVGVHGELGRLVERAVRARIQAVERLLVAAVGRGELPRPADLGAAAKSVVAFLIGLNTISKVVRDEGALWAMSRSFLIGLGIPPQCLGGGVPGPAPSPSLRHGSKALPRRARPSAARRRGRRTP